MESIDKQKIIQIGILVKDIRSSTKKWSEFLDCPLPQIFKTEGYDQTGAEYNGQPCHGLIYQSFFDLGNTQIELIQPVDDTPSIWYDCLQKNGEGIHHIAFKAVDMAKNIENLEKGGSPLLQKGEFKGGRYAYLDAMPSLQVILELLEFDQ